MKLLVRVMVLKFEIDKAEVACAGVNCHWISVWRT